MGDYHQKMGDVFLGKGGYLDDSTKNDKTCRFDEEKSTVTSKKQAELLDPQWPVIRCYSTNAEKP
jgi:hypothetical protein